MEFEVNCGIDRTENVTKQLVHASAVSLAGYEILGKFGEHSKVSAAPRTTLLYASFVLSKLPACFISRHTQADS